MSMVPKLKVGLRPNFILVAKAKTGSMT